MSIYNDLMENFHELTQHSARFRRVVLHVHSPDSHDFGDSNCDSKLNEKSQYLQDGGEKHYLARFGDKFDLVAITDHMKAGYACRLAQKTLVSSNENLCILPGIELNLKLAPPFNTMRLHLLVIFPRSKSLGEIERIFPGDMGIPEDAKRDGQEEIEIKDLAGFVQSIREEHNGLCIAAHIDNDHGVRKLFRQTGQKTLAWFNADGDTTLEQEQQISESFKDYLVAAKFDGIEVRSPKDRKHYTWVTEPESGIKHHVPVFLTFDAHSVEELERVDRVNYVKMADVSWQGLADAIKFPLTRIRFSDECVPPPHIIGIEIVSPTEKGFFPEIKLGFVENLNCIIGPRGSGKSTIVDAFRYAFGYNRSLDELDSEDLANAVKGRQAKNLQDSIIRIAYRVTEEEIHFLEATYDPLSNYTTKVYDISGNPISVTDVERDGKYPLRLFGWSEIETLGRNPTRQRELLDKLVSGLSELQDQAQELRRRLAGNSRTINLKAEELEEVFNSNDGEIKYYKDYKLGFEKLNTPKVRALFANLDQQRERLDFVQKLNKALQEFKARVEVILGNQQKALLQDGAADDCILDALDVSLRGMLNSDKALKSWWQTEAKLSLNLSSFQEQISKQINQILQSIARLNTSVERLKSKIEGEIADIEKEIRQEISDDPNTKVLADRRDEAKQRLERVEKIREEYNSALRNIRALVKERDEIIEDLILYHEKISDLRQVKKAEIEKKLNEFRTEDMVISVNFMADGDRSNFVDYLYDLKLLSNARRTFKAKRWPDLIAMACTPVKFAECILTRNHKLLEITHSIEGEIYKISSDDAQRVIETIYPFKKDESTDVELVDRQKLQAILEIQELCWDDSERILRNERPVDESSPGQRSSAMLPLIALAETVPLLIDQPEDNLDNRLVGKVLVDILTKLKETRQIIVTTHNPNIVVLGDAEQVMVLDAINDASGKVESPQASVDHPEIVKNVIELLEGGKEAFETRRKRYSEK